MTAIGHYLSVMKFIIILCVRTCLNVHVCVNTGTEFSYFLLPLCWVAGGQTEEATTEGKWDKMILMGPQDGGEEEGGAWESRYFERCTYICTCVYVYVCVHVCVCL